MTPILDRVRFHGGEATRDKWTIRLRAGRLTPAALEWLRERKEALMLEVWPEFDRWSERAAIREFCGGQSRDDAEQSAYDEVINA